MRIIKNIMMLVAMIGALTLTAGKVQAQGGGNGGGGRGGRGNFDPAQIKQNILDNLKTELSVTNDDEWTVLSDKLGKVIDAGMEARGNGGMNMFRLARPNRGGDNGGGNGGQRRFGPQPSEEEADLQKAIDDKVPAEELKAKLAKVRDVRAEKEAKVTAAQEDLKKIITSRQEAILVVNGILK